jgi:hypothetical protein
MDFDFLNNGILSKYKITTKDGNQCFLVLVHHNYGEMVIFIDDQKGEQFEDRDDVEENLGVITHARNVVCVDIDDNSVVVGDTIIKESLVCAIWNHNK